LPEAINDGQYLIPRLTRDERRLAITGPVGVTRGKMTEPLVNRLLNDVGDNPDQLPILQHALMRTWDYWAKHHLDREPIGLEHYEAIGTMAAALSLHADEAWDELPDERSRRIAELLFKALTERGADNREIRRPARLSEICAAAGASEEEVVAVVEVFRLVGRSFLMPPAGVELRPETVIDISHESLIRNWERLKKWVDEEAQSARVYRRVSEAAKLYDAGQESLLVGAGLQVALDWREKAHPNAAWAHRYYPAFAETMTFLDESKASHEAAIADKERQREEQLARERRELQQAQAFAAQQARAAQRLRRVMFAMLFVSLFALAAAGGAVYAYADARANKIRAEKEEEKAKAESDRAREAEQVAVEQKRLVLEQKGELEEQRNKAVKAEGDALIAQKKAEEEEEHAEEEEEHAKKEEQRANEEAARSAKLAADERAAREGLSAALKKAEAIREASQFFRDSLADFDRADDFNIREAYSQLDESVEKFEAVGDFGGMAAAYINLGAAHETVEPGETSQKVPLWGKAVENYQKIDNHKEAGATLESIGDELLAQALGPKSTDAAAESAGEEISASSLAVEETGDGLPAFTIEKFEDKVFRIPEEARPEIAARYEAAYDEYRQEASKSPPNETPGTLTDMRRALEKMGVLYGSLDGEANWRKAVKSYEQSESEWQRHSSGWSTSVNARLLRLYYDLGEVKKTESLVGTMLGDSRNRGELEEAKRLGEIAIWLEDHPEARKYAERSQALFRKLYRFREAQTFLILMGDAVTRIEVMKARRRQPLSDANYRLALEYYNSALALALEQPEPDLRKQWWTWDGLGRLNEATGHAREAAESYAKVISFIELNPKLSWRRYLLPTYYRKLAKTRQAANQLPQALETYKQYLALLDSTKADVEKCETARVRQIIATNGAAAAPPKASGPESAPLR